VPGFQVADWPNGPPIVVNQGLGDARARRMLVLIDGRAVYNPFLGGVEWQDLPLRIEDIERIEVVRGPNAASYGANAYQGVINIITRSLYEIEGAGVLLRAGPHDFRDAQAWIGRSNDMIDWRLSASSREASNFRDLNVPFRMIQERIDRQVLNAQLAWRPRADQKVNLRFGLTEGGDTVGSRASSSNPPRATGLGERYFDAGWKRHYGEGNEYSLRYYHYGRSFNDGIIVYPSKPTIAPVASLLYDRSYAVARHDLEFQHFHAFSEDLRALWGLGLRQDSAKSPGRLAGLGTVDGSQWQAFGNVEWRFTPNWLIHVGGMLEKHYNTDTLFSPRLALNHRLAPGHALRLSATRAWRAPTIFESNAREMVTWSGGVADVDTYAYRALEPERLDAVEFGYLGQWPALGLSLDARLFSNRYEDFIDTQSCIHDPETIAVNNALIEFHNTKLGVNCPPAILSIPGYQRPVGYSGQRWNPASQLFPGSPLAAPEYVERRFGHYKTFYLFNAGQVRVQGGDLALDWKNERLGRFRLGHAVIRIRAEGIGSDATLDVHNVNKNRDFEASAPHHSTSLLWGTRLPHGWRLSAAAFRVGKMKWANDGDNQPAYRRYDLGLAKTLGLFGKSDELAINVQNFRSEHPEFRGNYNADGSPREGFLVERRAFITYRLDW